MGPYDPPGRGQSPRDAAVDIIRRINPESIRKNIEFAGMVCRLQRTNLCFAFEGDRSRNTSHRSNTGVCPPGYVPVADWHTHGAESRPSDNFPSRTGVQNDLNSTQARDIPGYIGVPNGNIWEVIPNLGGPTERIIGSGAQ